MWLVWDYGERTGLKGWKGLSWGMVSANFGRAFRYLLRYRLLKNCVVVPVYVPVELQTAMLRF
jgi:hypothetical protein